MEKRFKNKVQSQGVVEQKLTPSEQDVLYMLTKEFLTVKQISNRRGTTIYNTYRFIRKLKKKGCFYSTGSIGSKSAPPISIKGSKNNQIITKLWRYHALHFVIKPYYFYPRYHKTRKELGNYGIPYRDWTIKLHPDMVEIQLKALVDFSSPDKWGATKKAEESFNKSLIEISNKFGFHVWNEGKANIKLVNHHLARNPSEIANARDGAYLTAKAIDGKIWFSIDKSKGAEHEYQHPDRALTDSEIVEPHLNDWLYNNPPILSEVWNITAENTKAINAYASIPETYNTSINSLTEQIQLHLNVMHNINKGLNDMSSTMASIRTALQPLREQKPNPWDVLDHICKQPSELAKFKLMSKPEQNKILFGREVPDEEL